MLLLWISHNNYIYQWYNIFNSSNELLKNHTKVQLSKVKLATVIEGNQKAPFSIATTQRCKGGHYSFPRIAPLYPWYVPYIAEC